MKKREKKQKRRLSTGKALMWRITAMLLGLWLAAMCYLTIVSAQELYDQWEDANETAVHQSAGNYYIDTLSMIRQQNTSCVYNLELPFFDDQCHSYTKVEDHCQQTSVYFDNNGNIRCESGTYAIVSYHVPTYGSVMLDMDHSCYIDLNDCPEALATIVENWWEDYWGDNVARFSGYFEGTKFIPLKFSLYATGERNYLGTTEEVDRLDWNVIFDKTEEADRELVTIYAMDMEYHSSVESSVTVNDHTFDNLSALAAADRTAYLASEQGEDSSNYYYDVDTFKKDGLWEAIFISRRFYEGIEYNGPWGFEETPEETLYDGLCITITRCYPIKSAMLRLLPVYLITLLSLFLPLLLIRRRIREDLTNPMNHVMKFAKDDYAALPDTVESDWREIYELEQGYIRTQQTIHEHKKEITQLKTALEYAKNAEENRKRMISNITHELKTPLAVISSYAEGLKEGIAADKQEHYLDVILEEAQRMDGMVLEMLDLSRLEAGKVRLSSDRFSLLELTKSVFDKLDPLVEEKSLEIEYIWPQEFEITADEGRICQVVTNFVTNAIKYSPEGGKIYIQVGRSKDHTFFTIGNQCEPLSEDALEKVWDSFYRTSASRTEKGTGLGLSISKAIVELHGGTCKVQNTDTGVEFRFELP